MAILRDEVARAEFSELVESGSERESPITPGEILGEEFMAPLGLSAAALARSLNVPTNRITALLHGRRGVTADTALRLARYFGTTPEFWMRLQADYDLRQARRTLSDRIAREVSPRAA